MKYFNFCTKIEFLQVGHFSTLSRKINICCFHYFPLLNHFFQVFIEVPVPIIPLTLIPFHCFVIVVVCFPFCHDITHLSSKRTLAHNHP